ncbi:radical SAM family heme chaperone HemW [Sulfurimonas sp.]|uniref:radical SAM family heme chaperone HemW n=1 Tax=Sulfurimonas sp. TaxID=2022749 RepID=UPI003D0E81FD
MLLYIHIPFCDSKCSYCAFNSYVDKFHLKREYMSALEQQLLYELKHFDVQEKSIESVFIGGGTPSTVSPALYKNIFTIISHYLQDNVEITTEANPNSATYEWLEGMKNLGVTRVSFGVQSFDNNKLKLLNRAHNSNQAVEAVHNANKIGFDNISLDLIYATLGDTQELLQNDLKTAFSLPINHLSLYALTIEEGTAFASKPQMSKEQLEDTKWLFKKIEEHGFKQYEISNFGLYNSVHNLGYWQYKDYIGIGAGAVGKLKNERYYPHTEIEKYIQNPLKITTEKLSSDDIKIEKIFLGLRSIVGFEQTILNNEEKIKADALVQEKKLTLQQGRYYNHDYLLSDEITLYITS